MIPETNPYNNWSGNGSSTTFDFDFYIEDATQLAVYRTGTDGVQTQLTYGTDYSINEFKNENGSYITFPLAGSSYDVLATGEVISLCLTLPISQENPFGKSSYLNLETLEYSLDYLTRICQIIQRELERAVKVQEGSDVDTDELTQDLIVVADNITDVNTVSGNIGDVNTVADNITDVNTVATNISNVNSTGSNIANVNTVATNISNVNTVKNSISNVNTVAGDIANVNAVAGNKTNIDAVKNNATNINTVAGDITNIDTVATNISSVNTVATNISNVNTVKNSISNVNTVAGDITNVNTVAGDKTNIDTCANNISAINAAPTYAETATTQAGIATDKADECIVALADAEALKNSLEMFSVVDCGYFNETQSIIHDAGEFDDTYTNYIDCGSFKDFYISHDDIVNLLNISMVQNQVNYNGLVLNNTISRVSENETDIKELQNLVSAARDDIDSNTSRIETNEDDISDLKDGLQETTLDLGSVTNRVEAAENDIDKLQDTTKILNYVDAGKFNNTYTNYYNAGEFDDAYTNYVDAGSFGEVLYLSEDDLTNVVKIGKLQAQADATDLKIKTEVNRLDTNINSAFKLISNNQTDIKDAQNIINVFSYIDCGYFGDAQSVVHNAGEFDDVALNYMDCGDFNGIFISREDLKNILTIPTIQNTVNALTGLMQSFATRLASLEDGIDCGLFAAR